MGASLLRSYEEEQRLVQENATLRSQLEALRRQCENEAEWRRDARSLQVPGYACACACARVRARACAHAQVHTHRRTPSDAVSARCGDRSSTRKGRTAHTRKHAH